jgi:hypothetical protein
MGDAAGKGEPVGNAGCKDAFIFTEMPDPALTSKYFCQTRPVVRFPQAGESTMYRHSRNRVCVSTALYSSPVIGGGKGA